VLPNEASKFWRRKVSRPTRDNRSATWRFVCSLTRKKVVLKILSCGDNNNQLAVHQTQTQMSESSAIICVQSGANITETVTALLKPAAARNSWNIYYVKFALKCRFKKVKVTHSSYWYSHDRATGRHLYVITVLPNTSERACPVLTPAHWRYSIYLPCRDGRLSWTRLPCNATAGSRTRDLSITSPMP